jgi:flagellar basal-body rod protein FlgF
MDRLLYVSMTGMNRIMDEQAQNANDIANAGTTGFKASLSQAFDMPVSGAGFDSRVNVVSGPSRPDLSSGTLVSTGRSLDVAVRGQGWLVVQDDAGEEALTRRGDLQVDVNGVLRTGDGRAVLGEGGPVAIPPYRHVTVGSDGTVSIVPLGQGPEAQAVLDRIRMVNPDPAAIERGRDGLFRVADGELPPSDAAIRLMTGHLETSNVNMAEAMVEMVDLSRRFEIQARMMRTARENGDSAARLLRMG